MTARCSYLCCAAHCAPCPNEGTVGEGPGDGRIFRCTECHEPFCAVHVAVHDCAEQAAIHQAVPPEVPTIDWPPSPGAIVIPAGGTAVVL